VAKGSASRYQPYGIELEGANNQIGGTDPADRNVISGNSTAVWVPNNPARAATDNLVERNLIGLDATGTKGITGSDGFDIESGSGVTIGGTATGASNVISGIDGRAIFILLIGPDFAADQQNSNGGYLIEGNFIGTDVTGTALVKSTILTGNTHNQGEEIEILLNSAGYLEPQDPIPSTIGRTAAGAGNVMSGNSGVAISINPDTVGTLFEGNFVGTDPTGTEKLGNLDLGLDLSSPASTIGGTVAGAANVVAYNHSASSGDAAGVVFGRDASGSSFLGNSVFGNGTEGFNTESATARAPPVITSLTTTSDGNTLMQGTQQDAVNASFRLEFFSNVVADPSGMGQGQTFLGAVEVMTDATGAADFSATVAAMPAGQGFVVATATDAANNTSGYPKYLQNRVSTAPTTTKLVMPSSPDEVGQTVALMSIVSAAMTGVPSGSVTFTIDEAAHSSVPLAVVNGQDQASLATSSLTVGTHVMTAAYSGDSSFQPSTCP